MLAASALIGVAACGESAKYPVEAGCGPKPELPPPNETLTSISGQYLRGIATMRERLIVVLDLEGKTVEGKLRPSSDTPTHRVLYREWHNRGVASVVHTHSTYATGWAQARTAIPIYGTTHADHLAEDVPCTAVMSDEAVERDYEVETGNQILECFAGRDPLHTPMVLVAGHAPFTWGKTPEKAVYSSTQ